MLRFFVGTRPDFERRAAEATLIALHEVLPIPALGAIDYAWLPSIAPMKRAQAIDWLIRSPKPLTCVALGISGTLAIGAWPTFRSGEGTPGVHRQAAERLVERSPVPGAGEEEIALVGQFGEVKLSRRELALWGHAYDLPAVELFYGEEGDVEAEKRQVTCVAHFRTVHVWRGGSGGLLLHGDPAQVSPEDLAQLPEEARQHLEHMKER